MRGRPLGGRHHLRLAGYRPPVGDVGAHRVVEQVDLLTDQGDRAAQTGERDRAYVLAIDQDRAVVDVIEPQDQVQHGRFAGARGSDQGDRLAGRDHQIDTAERRPGRSIAEPDPGEVDLAGADRERHCRRPVTDQGLAVEQAIDPLRRRHTHLDIGEQSRQRPQRPIGEQQCRDEREEGAGCGLARQHLPAAVEDHCSDRNAAEHLHYRPRERADPRGLDVVSELLLDQRGGTG